MFTFDLYMHMNGVYQWGYKDETFIYRSCNVCTYWVPTKAERFWHHELMKYTRDTEKYCTKYRMSLNNCLVFLVNYNISRFFLKKILRNPIQYEVVLKRESYLMMQMRMNTPIDRIKCPLGGQDWWTWQCNLFWFHNMS